MVTILCKDKTVDIESPLESWTTDGHHIFAAKEGIQKYSLPKARNESVFKLGDNSEMENAPSSESRILWLNGKLIVRDSQSEETPIRVFDPKTLQLDKEATEAIDKKWVESEEKKELTMKFMKEADKETGRLLKESPLFSDGTYLYVVSQQKHIKP